VDLAVAKLGEDVLLLDIRPVSSIADYFVICSAGSERQMEAICEDITVKLKASGVYPLHSEGAIASGWVLLDYGSVIVHVFLPRTRRYYGLEQLWTDARTIVRIQ
jgi:ribosome-associated protein